MSEWRTARLGTVATQRFDKVPITPGAKYDTMGVRWYGKGAYLRPPSRPQTKRLNRAHEGDFVFCRIDAHNGPFAVVPEELEGTLVTNEFPLYTIDDRALDARFLVLCFSRQSTRDRIGRLRDGRDGRARWKEADFEAWTIPLPPIQVQRRIVEVVAAVDRTIDALLDEVAAAGAARQALLGEMLQRRDDSWTDRPVGELGTLTRGKRFIKSDYVDSGIGCIHYSQIHTDFGALTTEVHSWLPEGLRPRLRFAQPGDLVIAGTSENLDGVLKAVAWLGDEPVAVHDDAYIFEHTLEPRFASYVLASPAFREQVQHVISDTKVVRVSKADFARLTVPVPPPETQTSIADTMQAIDRQISATADEAARAQTARAALLDALLTRNVEVTITSEDGE